MLIAAFAAAIPAAQAKERTLANCHPQAGMARRVAVVVGNGAYKGPVFGPLTNPKNDANDIAAAFCALGFARVDTFVDEDLTGLAQVMSALNSDGAGADMIVFFYSGHGVEYEHESYLVPAGYNQPLDELPTLGVPLDRVRESMRTAKETALRLVLLDACRDMLHKGSSGYGFGPSSDFDINTMVVYAALEGASALADPRQPNSYFTKATLERLKNRAALKNEDVHTFFWAVNAQVAIDTQQQQHLAFYDTTSGPYYFLPNPANLIPGPANGQANSPPGAVADEAPLRDVQPAGTADTGSVEVSRVSSSVRQEKSLFASDAAASPVERKAAFPTTGFVFPYSNVALLTPDQFKGKTKKDLEIGLNEIYARHGYQFASSDLAAYFANEPWYRPWGLAGDRQQIRRLLNDVERKNEDAILRHEHAL